MSRAARRSLIRPLGAALALSLLFLALAPRLTLVPSVAAAAPRGGTTMAFDRLFIDMMAPHHQGAIAMARIALARAEHPQIKTLAQSIIAAQEREIAQLKTWRVACWYGSAATPDMMHMPMLLGMSGMMSMGDSQHMMGAIAALKTARPFDAAFIDAMIPHHRMAIVAATLELTYGTHADLKAMAVAIIADQAREIGLMQAYRDVWYGGMMGEGH